MVADAATPRSKKTMAKSGPRTTTASPTVISEGSARQRAIAKSDATGKVSLVLPVVP